MNVPDLVEVEGQGAHRDTYQEAQQQTQINRETVQE